MVGLLSTLASLVALVAFIWLVVVAFKRSPLWGILVLLLSPITAVIFAIKHWTEAKKPFLVYAGGITVSVLCFLYTFSAVGGFAALGAMNEMRKGEFTDEDASAFIEDQLDRMESSGQLSAEEEAQLRQMRQAFEQARTGAADTTVDPPVARTARTAEGPARPLPDSDVSLGGVPIGRTILSSRPTSAPASTEYRNVPLREAGNHLGKVVRIVEKGGNDHRGTLRAADGSALMIERYLSSGTVALEFPTRDIASLHVRYR